MLFVCIEILRYIVLPFDEDKQQQELPSLPEGYKPVKQRDICPNILQRCSLRPIYIQIETGTRVFSLSFPKIKLFSRPPAILAALFSSHKHTDAGNCICMYCNLDFFVKISSETKILN